MGKIKDRDIHIRISDEKYKLVKILAERDRRKVSAIIEFALDRYLKERKI